MNEKLEAGPELEALPERPFVLLEWWDSRLAASWLDREVDLSPAVCRSVGWITSENEDYLAIAGTWSPTIDEFAAVIVIPVACIRKRIELTWPGEAEKRSVMNEKAWDWYRKEMEKRDEQEAAKAEEE